VLKQRIATGAILSLVAAWGILVLPTGWFGAVLLLIILIGAWEWAGVLGFSGLIARLGYCALLLGTTILAWSMLDNQRFVWLVSVVAAVYWCYVLTWLWRYSTDLQRHDPRLIWAVAGIMTLVAPWVALVNLHGTVLFGPVYVLFLMVLIWIADSGAFFAGRRWGRRKLAPRISPGKTWEGVIGALVATLIFSALGATALELTGSRWVGFIIVCMVAVLFSIVGDLFESMIKRQHEVKDSGSLLPGHGGVLDRIDSLTAAAPVFLLGLGGLLT
jgi:phosphatidate cytidylyltransferase